METSDNKIRWYDYITVNIYYFALTARSQTLGLIVPLLVLNFVGDGTKGADLGTIRLWGLMAALLFQAFAGVLSDRNTSPLGRRRPFILVGAITEVVVFILIGVIATSTEGRTGYWFLFVAYILSMISSNTGHAAAQGLIPDLVPESKHGLFSGFKALFELPVPMIFFVLIISKIVNNQDYWGALLALSVAVLLCQAITMFVRERPLEDFPGKIDWEPIIRLVAMTAVFTSIIILLKWGVNWIISLVGNFPDILETVTIITVGVLGMMVAVVLGVIVSVRISIGVKGGDNNKSFIWWIINRLSFLIGSTNLSVFAIYFLRERFFGQETTLFSQLMLYVVLAIFVASIPAGWLADKFGKKLMCLISGFLATIGTILVIISDNSTMLYIGGVILGVAIGFFYAASWALGTTLVPKEQAGRYLGIQNLAGAGAGAVGAYIGGPIGDNVGFTVLMSIFGFLFLVSALALFGIKKQVLEPEKLSVE